MEETSSLEEDNSRDSVKQEDDQPDTDSWRQRGNAHLQQAAVGELLAVKLEEEMEESDSSGSPDSQADFPHRQISPRRFGKFQDEVEADGEQTTYSSQTEEMALPLKGTVSREFDVETSGI